MKLKCTPKAPLIWHVLAIVIFSTLGVLILFLLYWSLEPFKPVLEINNAKVLTPTVKAGETLLFDYDYCKNQDTISGKVVRYFKDTVTTYLPTQDSNVEKGCGHATLAIDIPKSIMPDKYTFNYEVTYQVNPIKSETYYFESPEFEVIK